MDWPETLLTIGEDGPALVNSTTPTSLLPDSAKGQAIENRFGKFVGKTLLLDASGRISTVVTTPGTLTLELMLGSVVAWTSGAMALNVVAQTNVNWRLNAELVYRILGTGTVAKLLGQGHFKSHAVIGSPAPTAGGAGTHLLPFNTAPVVGTGFDNSAGHLLDIRATWSVANAANSITMHTCRITAPN